MFQLQQFDFIFATQLVDCRMTSFETDLCYDLIYEHFGKLVAEVTKCLCQNGWQPLRSITKDTGLKNDQVRKALCVLIQHKYAYFQLHKQSTVEYKCNIGAILKLSIYPRIIYTAKLLYGDAAELLVEEILQHGIMLMSSVVGIVSERLETTREKVISAFRDLVKTRFVHRESEVKETEEEKPSVPTFICDENNMFVVPNLSETGHTSQRTDDTGYEPDAKRRKTDKADASSSDSPEDDGIYWSVNITRFEQFFRDQTYVKSVARKFGASCGEILRSMLRISEVTTACDSIRTQPISSHEILRTLTPGNQIPLKHIEEHLRLMSNDSDRFLEAFDAGSAAGSYVINLKNFARALTSATVVSYVQERFGSKCCRIYRLLVMKKHLEQKQVEEFAMIPGKEAKEHLYTMLTENILTMQEIPRTPDHAPSRTFFLFSVNMERNARMLLNRSLKTMSNLLNRRRHCTTQNKRVLDKQNRIAAIKKSLQEPDEAQLEEIDGMLSASERAQLSKYEHSTNKLHTAQLQVTETILLLENYFKTLTYK